MREFAGGRKQTRASLYLSYPVWGQVQVTVALLPSLPEKKKLPFVQSLAGMEIFTTVC
jgi:hypothetical protein